MIRRLKGHVCPFKGAFRLASQLLQGRSITIEAMIAEFGISRATAMRDLADIERLEGLGRRRSASHEGKRVAPTVYFLLREDKR